MKKTSPKIVFFGNERLATGVNSNTDTFKLLLKNEYSIVALISNYSKERSRKNREPEIHNIAREHNIPIYIPEKMSDLKEQIIKFSAEIGILVAFGKIVPQSIIDIFPKGIINIHPSLLPKHRGPTPIESIILDNETLTGVSIMQLKKEMDAGPVFVQKTLKLNQTETKQELADKLLTLGASMIVESLPSIISGELIAKEQIDSQSTYDQLIKKKDGIIDWNKTAFELEREIRAFQYWPQSRTVIATKEVSIIKAHAVPSIGAEDKPGDITPVKEAGLIMVATSNGSLCIDELKPAGKNAMTVAAFLAGYGKNL